MIADHWLELEWKIKGKVDYPDEKLGWSFRAGAKLHDNQYITDVLYVKLFRSNLNAHFPFMSWINNSTFDVSLHFSEVTSHLVRQEYIVGKKYPKLGWTYAPTLDIGVVWTSPEEYAGVLRTSDANTLTFSDAIPANTTFVSVNTPAGWVRTDVVPVGGTGTITFTRTSMAAWPPGPSTSTKARCMSQSSMPTARVNGWN
jgi:hypothetical protein